MSTPGGRHRELCVCRCAFPSRHVERRERAFGYRASLRPLLVFCSATTRPSARWPARGAGRGHGGHDRSDAGGGVAHGGTARCGTLQARRTRQRSLGLGRAVLRAARAFAGAGRPAARGHVGRHRRPHRLLGISTSATSTTRPPCCDLGAAEAVGALARRAARSGLRRVVLLSGRGEPGAQAAEWELAVAGMEWAVVRASFFAQNFSEGFLVDAVRAGVLALPAGLVGEPFVDADDLADTAVAALTAPAACGRCPRTVGEPVMPPLPHAAAGVGTTGGHDRERCAMTRDRPGSSTGATRCPVRDRWSGAAPAREGR
jgi:hypothetical protein